jgi:hypothetical protein
VRPWVGVQRDEIDVLANYAALAIAMGCKRNGIRELRRQLSRAGVPLSPFDPFGEPAVSLRSLETILVTDLRRDDWEDVVQVFGPLTGVWLNVTHECSVTITMRLRCPTSEHAAELQRRRGELLATCRELSPAPGCRNHGK